MYSFTKYPHPVNFEFVRGSNNSRFLIGKDALAGGCTPIGPGIFHIEFNNTRIWKGSESRPFTDIHPADDLEHDGLSRVTLSKAAELTLKGHAGDVVLSSVKKNSFGVCGKSWMFCFRRTPSMEFFGLGERSTPFERSGRIHRFFNVDVFAGFGGAGNVAQKYYDPDYMSVPYLIVKQGGEYAGILLDTPYPSVVGIRNNMSIANQFEIENADGEFFYAGAENGRPSVYIIYGPTLPELTRKLSLLVGRAQLPPLWALGFHQCRWGYKSKADLEWLAENFEEKKIPVDGLWLDIDYMDSFRTFTFKKEHFPDPGKDIGELRRRGYRVVPIIDPGLNRTSKIKI